MGEETRPSPSEWCSSRTCSVQLSGFPPGFKSRRSCTFPPSSCDMSLYTVVGIIIKIGWLGLDGIMLCLLDTAHWLNVSFYFFGCLIFFFFFDCEQLNSRNLFCFIKDFFAFKFQALALASGFDLCFLQRTVWFVILTRCGSISLPRDAGHFASVSSVKGLVGLTDPHHWKFTTWPSRMRKLRVGHFFPIFSPWWITFYHTLPHLWSTSRLLQVFIFFKLSYSHLNVFKRKLDYYYHRWKTNVSCHR